MIECIARPDCLCRCEPEEKDYCHYSEETAERQKMIRVQSKAKQAMLDIERDELDHDNVEHIVTLMILAGYEKE